MNDPVNHPQHYTSHPSGVECIQVTEHFNFCVGNAIKYLWRAGEKGNYHQDLRKAIWYITREIERTSHVKQPGKQAELPQRVRLVSGKARTDQEARRANTGAKGLRKGARRLAE